MTFKPEFTNGIFKLIASTSGGRAFVYTIGHVLISMMVVRVMTTATWWEAGSVVNRMLTKWFLVLLTRQMVDT